MSTIYKELTKRGIEVDNHYSDLYVLKTDETTELVMKYAENYSTFISRIDNKVWFDIPFAYEPYWERKVNERTV